MSNPLRYRFCIFAICHKDASIGGFAGLCNVVACGGPSVHDCLVNVASRSSLLQPVQAGASLRRRATLGWFEDDTSLAMGYLDAADVLAAHWKAHRPNDQLILPILSNYRHGIELALKAVIRMAARCLRDDGHQDAELQRANLNAELAATHSIGGLADRLIRYFEMLDLEDDERLPARTKDILSSLHALDDSGQWFRYSTVKQGYAGKGKDRKPILTRARPNQINFDLEVTATQLHEAGITILGGLDVLDQYAEWQDYVAEAADW